jgi:hypothetical protein
MRALARLPYPAPQRSATNSGKAEAACVAGAELKEPSGVSFRDFVHPRAVPRAHSCESDTGRGSFSAAGATWARA